MFGSARNHGEKFPKYSRQLYFKNDQQNFMPILVNDSRFAEAQMRIISHIFDRIDGKSRGKSLKVKLQKFALIKLITEDENKKYCLLNSAPKQVDFKTSRTFDMIACNEM